MPMSIFLAVGTPSSVDGSADLDALWVVADQLAEVLHPQTLVVTKSTVPVGTNAQLLCATETPDRPGCPRRQQPGIPQGRSGHR